MTLHAPTADTVHALSYVDLLALAGESNLPPGGLATVRRMALHTHLRPGVRALHVGSSTGFVSRELARRTGCALTGVDISPAMVDRARRRAAEEGLDQLVEYRHADMRDTGLDASVFDVALSAGALAFVADGQQRAVAEMVRVVRRFGLVAAAELYYERPPPDRLLADVSAAIGVRVPRYRREDWTSLFSGPELQPYYERHGDAEARTDAEVETYCGRMVDHVAAGWEPAAREALAERWLALFTLFNENMKYLRYIVLVRRCVDSGGEPALFV